ncbi:MAG: MFS transporter [Acidobacteria bacterium]|nr:MFS transporter [Acidobacteriota bacterium]
MSTPPARGEALLYAGFFPIGMSTVLLGPLIPELCSHWRLTTADASTLFLPFFAASAAASVVSTFALRRSVVLGYGSAGLGALLLPLVGWPLARWVVILIGLGIGLASPATNVLIAQRHPERRGAALTVLNLIWGVGAVSCPLLFAAFLGVVDFRGILFGLGVLEVVWMVLLWRSPALAEEPAPSDQMPAKAVAATDPRPRSPAGPLALLAVMFFLYIGSETALGGWMISLADQVARSGTIISMLIGASFWAAFLTGRAVAPLVLRRLSEPAVYAAALALSITGGAGVYIADGRGALTLASALTGFGLAPLFPLTASFITTHSSRGAGWAFALGSLGGAVLPWATGQMTRFSGDLRQGFLVPLGALVVLAVLFAGYQRWMDGGSRRKT